MNYVSLIIRIMKYVLGGNNNNDNNNNNIGPVDRGGWKITTPALQASSLKDRTKGYPERKRCGKKTKHANVFFKHRTTQIISYK